MGSQRIAIMINKKENSIKHAKREVAKLLELGKEEKARIRAEHLIREDFTLEALEIVQLMCELLYERVKHLGSSVECPSDLEGAVATLLYASSRVDVSELQGVRAQLTRKFGHKYVEDIVSTENLETTKVNTRVAEKLAVRPPTADAVLKYLQKTAAEFNVNWTPTEIGVQDKFEALSAPIGFSVPMAPGTNFGDIYQSPEGPPRYSESYGDASVPSVAPASAHIPTAFPVVPQHIGAGGVKKAGSSSEQQPPPMAYAMPPADAYFVPQPPPVYMPQQGPPAAAMQPPALLPQAPATVVPPAAPPSDAAQLPPPPASSSGGTTPSYDELASRFAALRK